MKIEYHLNVHLSKLSNYPSVSFKDRRRINRLKPVYDLPPLTLEIGLKFQLTPVSFSRKRRGCGLDIALAIATGRVFVSLMNKRLSFAKYSPVVKNACVVNNI